MLSRLKGWVGRFEPRAKKVGVSGRLRVAKHRAGPSLATSVTESGRGLARARCGVGLYRRAVRLPRHDCPSIAAPGGGSGAVFPKQHESSAFCRNSPTNRSLHVRLLQGYWSTRHYVSIPVRSPTLVTVQNVPFKLACSLMVISIC
jgi:hypothetical protein